MLNLKKTSLQFELSAQPPLRSQQLGSRVQPIARGRKMSETQFMKQRETTSRSLRTTDGFQLWDTNRCIAAVRGMPNPAGPAIGVRDVYARL